MANGIGRPTDYNNEIATEICELLAGGMAIRQVVALSGIPSWSTIRSWLLCHAEFQTLYARANEYAAEWEFAGISELERRVLEPRRVPTGATDDDGEPIMGPNPDWIDPSAAKVVIDSRKWRMAKMRPKVYGDHSSRTLTVEPGQGYAALLEEIDKRKPMIDMGPVVTDNDK